MTAAAPVYARRFVSLVKLEHTVFALPFAFVGAILSAGEVPSAKTLGWITLAMVGARSLAMALNRLIDAEIDARNPRTAMREIPAGLLTQGQVVAFCAVALAVFLIAVWHLDPLVRWLWPLPVVAFVIYPYLKRFTWLCHLGLGLATGMAPAGAWLAVTGDAAPEPFMLWAAVCLWIGGFDVIYATTDVEFDRREGLHSLPARFGIAAGLAVTRVCHVLAVALLAGVGISLGLGALYFLGLAVVACLLAWENSIVHADDLSRVNVAFFTTNGVISIVFLAGVLADVLL
jgi:4-hydroxybenzoate polyprenyltransferase